MHLSPPGGSGPPGWRWSRVVGCREARPGVCSLRHAPGGAMYDLFAALDRRPCWQPPLLKSSPWQRIPVGDCACLGLVCRQRVPVGDCACIVTSMPLVTRRACRHANGHLACLNGCAVGRPSRPHRTTHTRSCPMFWTAPWFPAVPWQRVPDGDCACLGSEPLPSCLRLLRRGGYRCLRQEISTLLLFE